MPTRTTWTCTLVVIADKPREVVADHEFAGAVQAAVANSVGPLVKPAHLEVSIPQQDLRVDTEV
jgi:hypothetical protein